MSDIIGIVFQELLEVCAPSHHVSPAHWTRVHPFIASAAHKVSSVALEDSLASLELVIAHRALGDEDGDVGDITEMLDTLQHDGGHGHVLQDSYIHTGDG